MSIPHAAWLWILAAFLTMGTILGAEQAASQRWIAEGRPRFAIVMPSGAAEPVPAAVADVQLAVERICGQRPEVVRRPGEARTPLMLELIVGRGSRSLGSEGYVLDLRGTRARVTARTPDGVSHGLYDFLARLGAEWYTDQPDFAVFPPRRDADLPRGRWTRRPAFAHAIWPGMDAAWLRRNRLTRERMGIPYFGGGHNLHNIFPVETLGQSHPEYFARFRSEDGQVRFAPLQSGAQPCFTNPDVIRIAIQKAQEHFRLHPRATTYSLCPNDTPDMCQCTDCARLDEPYDQVSGFRQHTDSYMHFVDTVARALLKSHPDKFVQCYAYWATVRPPRRLQRLASNVVVHLTQDSSQYFDPAYRDQDYAVLARWQAAARQVVRYDYYGLGWLTPRFFPHHMARDYRQMRDRGVVGLFCEGYTFVAHAAPQLYLASRLYWDPDLDPDAVLDAYYTTLFGQAAPAMKAFYQALETGFTKPRSGAWFEGYHDMEAEMRVWSGADILAAGEILDQALARADDPAARRRVEYIRTGYAFTRAVGRIIGMVNRLRDGAVAQAADVEVAVAVLCQADSAFKALAETHQAHIASDPAYTGSYYGNDTVRYQTKVNMLKSALCRGLLSCLARLQRANADDAAWMAACGRAVADPAVKDLFQAAALPLPVPLVVACPRAAAPLSPDSDPSAWAALPAVDLLAQGKIASFEARASEDAAPLGARLRLAWDEAGLFLALDVTDSRHVQEKSEGRIWAQDSLQVGLNPNREPSPPGGYGPHDGEFGFALTPGGEAAWCWQAPPAVSRGPIRDIALRIRRQGNQTLYALRFPWARLAPLTPNPGAVFGLSLLINDDNGLGRRFLEWGGGMAGHKEPGLFIGVRLVE